jgi:hypothetical protein
MCGCSNLKSTESEKSHERLFAVTPSFTPFYFRGPHLGNDPDKILPQDTLLTLVRPSFGFCKVRLTTGEEGYVRNDDIKVAPLDLVGEANGTSPSPQTRLRGSTPAPRLNAPQALPEFEPTPIPALTNSGN